MYLCAGWYATLGPMLFESGIIVDKIRSFDIDPSCIEIAEIFNKRWVEQSWRFKAITDNILNLNYDIHEWTYWSKKNNRMSYPIKDAVNTIINTSCEHVKNFDKWYEKIPIGKLVILQTNNFKGIEDHVNCSESLEQFGEITPLSELYYEGELDVGQYKRFMRIGHR